MKRMIALALCLALCLVLTACGQKTPPAPDGDVSQGVSDVSDNSEVNVDVTTTAGTEDTSTATDSTTIDKVSVADTTTTMASSTTTAKSSTTKSTKSTTTAATTKRTSPPTQAGHKHEYNDQVYQPNCLEEGFTDHLCSCGDIYRDSITPKTDHKYEWSVVKAATTTETGVRELRCAYCGTFKQKEEIPKQKSESKIDSRVTIGAHSLSKEPMYTFKNGSVIDHRSWGDRPAIEVLDGDVMKVTYYNQQGQKIVFNVEQPASSDRLIRFVILDDGTYTSVEVGSFS
ncbi:MAG: hypothetical protein IKU51_07545 [Clostridia bacterium]|nr:hypothetical protein [Clostridia bacterium]